MRWRLLKNRKFTTKLIIIFIVTALIPLILISVIEYDYFQKALKGKTSDYLQNIVTVTMSKMEMSIKSVEDIAFYISSNQTVQKTLLAEEDPEVDNIAFYAMCEEMRVVLSYYALLREEILSVYIQSEQGQIYRYAKNRQYAYDKELKELTGIEDNVWLIANNRILLIRPINQYPNKKNIGKLVIEINTSVFYDLIKDIEYRDEGTVWVIDQNGYIISGQDGSLTGQQLSEDYEGIVTHANQIIHDVKIDDKSYSVCLSKEAFNGWKLLVSVPIEYIMEEIHLMRNWIFLILACICSLAVFLFLIISNSITRPIRNLSRVIEDVGHGNFEVNCVVEGEDEIAMLSRTFHQMVIDMKCLINSVYEQKMLKQSAELKSLQMQINPHFLYNTLDTINWLSRMEGLDEVGNLTAALGNLMRYSLSSKEFVTIEEEIRNLKDYLEIQNNRYGDKMTTKLMISEQVLACYIPKLLIQPILENAIVHGVEDKVGTCEIKVRAYQQDMDLFIEVEDDGVGMTQNAFEQIMKEDFGSEKKGHTSIGIYNVNRRIQMAYGQKYGLQIQSKLGDGTKITLHMKMSIK